REVSRAARLRDRAHARAGELHLRLGSRDVRGVHAETLGDTVHEPRGPPRRPDVRPGDRPGAARPAGPRPGAARPARVREARTRMHGRGSDGSHRDLGLGALDGVPGRAERTLRGDVRGDLSRVVLTPPGLMTASPDARLTGSDITSPVPEPLGRES